MIAAAVLVAIVDGPDPGVLLTQRVATLRAHAGQVSFPGGRIDPGDADPEAAALREAREEIGLDPAGVRLAGRLPVHHTATGYQVTPVIGRLAADPVLALQAAEVAAVFQLPLRVLHDAFILRRREDTQGSMPDKGWECRHDGFRIWGATAAILTTLIDWLAEQAASDEAPLSTRSSMQASC